MSEKALTTNSSKYLEESLFFLHPSMGNCDFRYFLVHKVYNWNGNMGRIQIDV